MVRMRPGLRTDIRRIGKEWWGKGEDETGTWDESTLGQEVRKGGGMVRMRPGHGKEGYWEKR